MRISRRGHGLPVVFYMPHERRGIDDFVRRKQIKFRMEFF